MWPRPCSTAPWTALTGNESHISLWAAACADQSECFKRSVHNKIPPLLTCCNRPGAVIVLNCVCRDGRVRLSLSGTTAEIKPVLTEAATGRPTFSPAGALILKRPASSSSKPMSWACAHRSDRRSGGSESSASTPVAAGPDHKGSCRAVDKARYTRPACRGQD